MDRELPRVYITDSIVRAILNPTSVNTKENRDYILNIGSANKVITITDDLVAPEDLGTQNAGKFSCFSTITAQNDDDISGVTFTHNGVEIPVRGTIDPTRQMVYSIFRIPRTGTNANQLIMISCDSSLEKAVAATNPTVSSVTVENIAQSNLVMVLSEACTGDLTGFSIASDGDPISITSLTSGSGSATWSIALSRDAVHGETLTISVGASNTVISVSSSTGLVATEISLLIDIAIGYTVAYDINFDGGDAVPFESFGVVTFSGGNVTINSSGNTDAVYKQNSSIPDRTYRISVFDAIISGDPLQIVTSNIGGSIIGLSVPIDISGTGVYMLTTPSINAVQFSFGAVSSDPKVGSLTCSRILIEIQDL